MILVHLFSVHSAAEPLSRTLGALTLAPRPSKNLQGESQVPPDLSVAPRKEEKAPDSGLATGTHPVGTQKVQSHPGAKMKYLKVRRTEVLSR